jgi:poly(3-hydroxybutyrate) depolymerase
MRLASTLLSLCLAAVVARAEALTPGAGRFDFSHGGKNAPVWYYLPEKADARTPIVFVMHGVGRDADGYRDHWVPHASKGRFIVLVPEFSNAEFPGNDAHSSGGMKHGQTSARPAEGSSFTFLEPIFDRMKSATGNRSDRYHLYGHSAGAQFVHRYLYFVPQARVARAVAANAGWWTMPDLAVDFPYGLKSSALDDAALRSILARPLTILLGTADTDPNDKNLRRTPEAAAQGPHRFARGHAFFEAGKKQAAERGVPFGWQLATAPGIGHSDAGMSAFAVPCLFGPRRESRP